MEYYAVVNIDQEVFDRVNRRLDIESFEEMSDEDMHEAGIHTDWSEGVFEAVFDDGSRLTYDLCSGRSNYYDDVVWTGADGKRSAVLDCTFELADIEFSIDGTRYFVKINAK